jgi:hypothetical protein
MATPLRGAVRPVDKRKRMIGAAVFSSIVIYAVIVGVLTGDPKVRAKMVEAFGPRPLNLPTNVFVVSAVTVLYAPVPLLAWHLVRLALKAGEDGRRFGWPYLLIVEQLHPEMRASQRVALAGVAYWLVIAFSWIIYASARGI